MAIVIKDCKIAKISETATIVPGTIYTLDQTVSYTADDSSKIMLKGSITLPTDESVALELIGINSTDSSETSVALIKLDTTVGGIAKYGFLFTPTTGFTYKINIYREVALQTS